LNATAFQVAEVFVLIGGAGLSGVSEEFEDGVLGASHDSGGGGDAHALSEKLENECPFLGCQPVHHVNNATSRV